MSPSETETGAISRRKVLAAVPAATLTGLAGCTSDDTERFAESCSVVSTDVELQESRVGVYIRVKNQNFAGGDCPVTVTLYRNGESFREACVGVGADGGTKDSRTKWFQLESGVGSDEYSVDAVIDQGCAGENDE